MNHNSNNSNKSEQDNSEEWNMEKFCEECEKFYMNHQRFWDDLILIAFFLIVILCAGAIDFSPAP